MGRLDPRKPVSLLANLLGASAILYSLFTEAFNLSAVAMEGGLPYQVNGNWNPPRRPPLRLRRPLDWTRTCSLSR